jgi:RNA polymerase sigma-70 factor, ECF subfamily
MHGSETLQYIDHLFRYAMVLARNRSEAEDLVQETYVRALGAVERLRPDSNVKVWMFTILRNVWRNQLRSQRAAPRIVELDSERVGTFQDPHAVLVTKMEGELVREAIRQLPEDAREIIVLREYEDMSYQEIADLLDCPLGTVMSRLGRARSRLRMLISQIAESNAWREQANFEQSSGIRSESRGHADSPTQL